MPFRPTFSCLWCGASHAVRSADDTEGWAQLCPTCLGRAGENEFLRFRLRAAIEERGRARAGVRPPLPGPTDDWYLRRGRYAHGAIEDALWATDLDGATLWLDELPLAGDLVEPVAGEGWWSPLLAGKGELWVHDADGSALDRARARLVAHGLRAHLHERDPWLEPERPFDVLFTAFWLGRLDTAARPAWLALARRWLRPGGRFVLLELAAETGGDGAGPGRVEPDELASRLGAAGFADLTVERAGSIVRASARI
jgi:SAM-dependent methyltransferase